MSRYTEAQLCELIGQVNRLTGAPERACELIGSDYVRTVGHHYMRRAAGGYMLARVESRQGDSVDVFGQGWMTKPQLGARVESFLLGLECATKCGMLEFESRQRATA